MTTVSRQTIIRYAVALAVVVFVTLLKRFIISLIVGDQQWFLLLVAAICVSSWYGGFGPGIVTVVLSTLAADVFFISPFGGVTMSAVDLFQLMLFLIEGLMVAALTSNLRETRAQAQTAESTKDETLALLETFQVYAPVGLAFLDNDLRYVRINYLMAELNGLTPAAHIGRTLQEVQTSLTAATLDGVRQVVHTGKPLLDQEVTVVRPTMLGPKKQSFLTSYYRVRGTDGQPLGVGVVMVDITERKQAEDTLRESETRFRIMADTAPVMIWMADTDMQGTYYNKVWLDFTGRAIEQELGDGWEASVHPDDIERCREIYRTASASRQPYEMEYRLRRYDGEYRWILDYGVPRFTPDGVYTGYIGSSVDISERKRLEAGQQFILQAGMLLASSLDYETTLAELVRLAVPTIADWCAVDLLTPEGAIQRVAVAHIDPDKVRWAYELQERFPSTLNAPNGVGRVLRTGETEFVPDLSALIAPIYDTFSDEVKQIMDRLQAVSVITTPLKARGITIGALTFATAESGRRYTVVDVQLAEQLANRAALAVDNARLYGDARAERERFHVTLSSIGDAVIATDQQGKVTFINQIAERLTGWPEADALGKPLDSIFKIVNEQTRQTVESPVERVLSEGIVVGLANHTVLVSKTGHEFPIDDSGAPIPAEDGSVSGVVLVFRDVSERKRTERRQQFLAEAGNLLISSQDYESTLQQIVRLAVPALADWAIIYLAEDGGSIREAIAYHSDPAQLALRAEMMQRYRPSPDHAHGYPYVIRTGQPELLNDLAPENLEAIARDAEHLRYLRALNYRSSITVPLKLAARTFGAFALAISESARVYNQDDLVLLEELGKLISLAIQNAQFNRRTPGSSPSAPDEHGN